MISRLQRFIDENNKFHSAWIEIKVDGPIITFLYIGSTLDERLSSLDEPFQLRDLDKIMQQVRSTPWVPWHRTLVSHGTLLSHTTPHHFWAGYIGTGEADATPLTIPGVDSYERRTPCLDSFIQGENCSRDWINNPDYYGINPTS